MMILILRILSVPLDRQMSSSVGNKRPFEDEEDEEEGEEEMEEMEEGAAEQDGSEVR